MFEVISFIVWEHLFQFLLLIVSLALVAVFFIAKSILKTYPDMLMDALGMFQILAIFFKKKSKHVELADRHIDRLQEHYDNIDSKINEKAHNLVYPYLHTVILASVSGYIYYLIFDYNSFWIGVLFDFISIVIAYYAIKIFSKYWNSNQNFREVVTKNPKGE